MTPERLRDPVGISRRGLVLAGAGAAMWTAFAQARPCSHGFLVGETDFRTGPPGRRSALPRRPHHERLEPGGLGRARTTLGYARSSTSSSVRRSTTRRMNTMLAPFTTLTMTSKQIYDTYVVPNQTHVPITELETATVLRGVLLEAPALRAHGRVLDRPLQRRPRRRPGAVAEDDRRPRRDPRARAGQLPGPPARRRAERGDAATTSTTTATSPATPNENYGARGDGAAHARASGTTPRPTCVEVARCLTGWQYWPGSTRTTATSASTRRSTTTARRPCLGHVSRRAAGRPRASRCSTLLATHPTTAQFVVAQAVPLAARVRPAAGGRRPGRGRVPRAPAATSRRPCARSSSRHVVAVPAACAAQAQAAVPPRRARSCAPARRRSRQPARFVNELTVMGHRPCAGAARTATRTRPSTGGVRAAALELPRRASSAGTRSAAERQRRGALRQHAQERPRARRPTSDPHRRDARSRGRGGRAGLRRRRSPTLNDTLRRDVLALAALVPELPVRLIARRARPWLNERAQRRHAARRIDHAAASSARTALSASGRGRDHRAGLAAARELRRRPAGTGARHARRDLPARRRRRAHAVRAVRRRASSTTAAPTLAIRAAGPDERRDRPRRLLRARAGVGAAAAGLPGGTPRVRARDRARRIRRARTSTCRSWMEFGVTGAPSGGVSTGWVGRYLQTIAPTGSGLLRGMGIGSSCRSSLAGGPACVAGARSGRASRSPGRRRPRRRAAPRSTAMYRASRRRSGPRRSTRSRRSTCSATIDFDELRAGERRGVPDDDFRRRAARARPR